MAHQVDNHLAITTTLPLEWPGLEHTAARVGRLPCDPQAMCQKEFGQWRETSTTKHLQGANKMGMLAKPPISFSNLNDRFYETTWTDQERKRMLQDVSVFSGLTADAQAQEDRSYGSIQIGEETT